MTDDERERSEMLSDLEREVERLKTRSTRIARINWWLTRIMGVNGVLLTVVGTMPPHQHPLLDLCLVGLGCALLGSAGRDVYRGG